ncbi:MAG: hypothetical protein QNJ33_00440 [Crocosphaera sp.]|nr:hypothetical protein [Crocosphaera sp.]
MIQKIVQIVPRLPPYTDGVGDYALMLAEHLLKQHHIKTHFLVCRPDIYPQKTINGFSITVLPSLTTEAFLSVFPSDAQNIILQYSNYPYLQGKLDIPFWLPRALDMIIQKYHLKLLVMFHELPTLKWKKLRLFHPLQCQVSRYLARIAHYLVTNNSQFQKIINNWSKKSVDCLPNFSTIGESEKLINLQKRKNQIVIFGTTSRCKIYQNALPKLLKICKILDIQTIYDIGKSLELKQQYNFRDVNLVEMGFQPSEVIQEILLNSKYGCLDYSHFPKNLAKSTVFAAFSAHGLVPFLTENNYSQSDGLQLNQHYLVLDEQFDDLEKSKLESVANNAHQWYLNHTLAKNTKVFASYFH